MKLSGYVSVAVLSLMLAACDASDKTPEAPLSASASSEAPDTKPEAEKVFNILALGDSLFAGYHLREEDSYPAQLEAGLKAQDINANVINAGVSGDTTAGGLERLAFTLDSQATPPDLVIISLGGNDLLRGLPPEQTRANLEAILQTLKERKIPAVLMGVLAPPNLGVEYRRAFDPIYPALSSKYGAKLVPFFLQPLQDDAELVQDDHIHPTAQGVEAMVGITIETVKGALPNAAARVLPTAAARILDIVGPSNASDAAVADKKEK